MTDKKYNHKNGLTSAVEKWIEQKGNCDKLRKDAPNVSFKNLLNLLVNNIRSSTAKRKLQRDYQNVEHVLKLKQRDIDELLLNSKKIYQKTALTKMENDIEILEKEGVDIWGESIKKIGPLVRNLFLQSYYVGELRSIKELELDIGNANKALLDQKAQIKANDICNSIMKNFDEFFSTLRSVVNDSMKNTESNPDDSEKDQMKIRASNTRVKNLGEAFLQLREAFLQLREAVNKSVKNADSNPDNSEKAQVKADVVCGYIVKNLDEVLSKLREIVNKSLKNTESNPDNSEKAQVEADDVCDYIVETLDKVFSQLREVVNESLKNPESNPENHEKAQVIVENFDLIFSRLREVVDEIVKNAKSNPDDPEKAQIKADDVCKPIMKKIDEIFSQLRKAVNDNVKTLERNLYNDYENIITKLTELYPKLYEIADDIMKKVEIENIDLESERPKDKLKKRLEKLDNGLDKHQKSINDQLGKLSSIRDTVKGGICGALRVLQEESKVQLSSIVFVATLLVGAAVAYPRYMVWGILIFDSWVLQDFINQGALWAWLLLIPLFISVCWIRYAFDRSIDVMLPKMDRTGTKDKKDSKDLSWPFRFTLAQKGTTIISIITLLFLASTVVGSYIYHRLDKSNKLISSSQPSEIALMSNSKLLENIRFVGTSSQTAFVLIADPENSASCDSSVSNCGNDAENTDEDGENALKMMRLDRAAIICRSEGNLCKLVESEEPEEPEEPATKLIQLFVNVNGKINDIPDTSINFIEAAYQCYNARNVGNAYFQTDKYHQKKACSEEIQDSEQCPTLFDALEISKLVALEEVQKVLVVGRTSDEGDHSSNLELGSKRAKEIGDGIAPMLEEGVNIQIESLGELFGVSPSGPNDPAERRVEIFVCKDAA